MKTLQEIFDFETKIKGWFAETYVLKKFIDDGEELLAWQTVFGMKEDLQKIGLELEWKEVEKLAQGEAKRWWGDGTIYMHTLPSGEHKSWHQNGTLWYHFIPNVLSKQWFSNGVLLYLHYWHPKKEFSYRE